MGDFSLDWLALREAADARARSAALSERLAGWLSEQTPLAGEPDNPLTVLDLGCGTGSNLRYLAPRLPPRIGSGQRWICLDRDEALLADLRRRTAEWAGGLGLAASTDGDRLRIEGAGARWEIITRPFDLAIGVPPLPMGRGALVTASALLDLVSGTWLEGLIRTCSLAGAPLLLALTYDGRVVIEPEHPLDDRVIDLVNAHQRRDKGFGPALGPGAAARLAQLAEPLGFSVSLADSDWRLGPDEAGIQRALTEGWTAAAVEQAGDRSGRDVMALRTSIQAWGEVRRAEIGAGRSRIRVGHKDALLLPLGSEGSRPTPAAGER